MKEKFKRLFAPLSLYHAPDVKKRFGAAAALRVE